MANMVTRTIKTTHVTVIGADLTTNQVVEYEEILPRTYKDEKAIMKELSKNVSPDSLLKPVAISKTWVEDVLYGMTEEDFIANAKVLPPRTTKKEN